MTTGVFKEISTPVCWIGAAIYLRAPFLRP